ncbi:MAG: hypothetical protein WBX00_33370 [Isosphaeraceae bacterium]
MVGEGEPPQEASDNDPRSIVATTITYLENNQNSDLKVDQTIEISEGSDTFKVIPWATVKAAQR